MSTKERRRLVVLGQVLEGHLTVKGAAALLGLSERQARRLCKRYRTQGDAGVVHRLRGRPGNRRGDPAVRQRVVALYRQHYDDFGCTLACEYLAERHGLTVDDQTLRRWLAQAGLWRRRRRGPVKRRRRARKPCLGQLVQIDGSHHDWFEGRRRPLAEGTIQAGEPCVLMVMIDDATGLTEGRFVEAETTQAAMTIFRQWSLRHGLPLELYPDRHSIYRVNGEAADAIEARTGKRPLTQLGRAMAQLGVKLTCAHSPQAKGRVERMNGTLQDRLVKALRLAGINDLDAANAYLDQRFLPQLNARFTVEPAETGDVHRPIDAAELDAALCTKDQRTVGRDQCVRWEGRTLQLQPDRRTPMLAGKAVCVQQSLDGAVSVHWRDRIINWQPADQPPRRGATPPSTLAQRLAEHRPAPRPAADHPWRQPAMARPQRVGLGSATASAPPRPPLRQGQPVA